MSLYNKQLSYDLCNDIIELLTPGRYGSNLKSIIFKLITNKRLDTHCEIAFKLMPQNLTNENSTLFQQMAWCHQATSYYLSQCWARSVLPCGVTKPQWVKFYKLWCYFPFCSYLTKMLECKFALSKPYMIMSVLWLLSHFLPHMIILSVPEIKFLLWNMWWSQAPQAMQINSLITV